MIGSLVSELELWSEEERLPAKVRSEGEMEAQGQELSAALLPAQGRAPAFIPAAQPGSLQQPGGSLGELSPGAKGAAEMHGEELALER